MFAGSTAAAFALLPVLEENSLKASALFRMILIWLLNS